MSTTQPRIANPCDHMVYQEQLQMLRYVDASATDFLDMSGSYQYFRLAYPVASTGTLQLFRFGDLVPEDRYVLEDDADRAFIQESQFRYKILRLLDTDRSSNPLYEVTYYTAQQFCNKCAGTAVTDDLVQDATGNPKTVIDTDNLRQQVEKFIRTDLGSNKYHTWVGSRLGGLIGTKVTNYDLLFADIKSFLRESLIQALQNVQLNHASLNTAVSEYEILGGLDNIDISLDPDDPTVVYVSVDYHSKNGQVLNYTGEIVTS